MTTRTDNDAAISSEKPTPAVTRSLDAVATPTMRERISGGLQRVKDGDLGPLPVIVGLIIIWVFFQVRNENFLTARNLNNLILQIAVLGTLALGLVMVLVIGEIDLSIAAVSGFCAGVLAQLLAHGWGAGRAIIFSLVAGLVIGLVQGALVVFVHMPSFVVTLTGLLVWQGLLLGLIGDAGEVRIADPFIKAIASSYLTTGFAWTLGILLIAGVLAAGLLARRSELRLGLTPKPWFQLAVRVAVVAAAVAVVVTVLGGYFGVPWVLVLLVALVIILSMVLTQTAWGQHLYAIGGNREAARRAGIGVRGSVLAVFAIASTIAAVAGILDASRQFAVSNAAGGGNLGLNAIAAVVIGGTSLFGGRGKAYTALLGALVVGSVANGLDLLGESAAVKNTTTGIILLAAVAVDALSRRRRQLTGRAA